MSLAAIPEVDPVTEIMWFNQTDNMTEEQYKQKEKDNNLGNYSILHDKLLKGKILEMNIMSNILHYQYIINY